MRFRGENLGQNGLTHCDARHQIRDFCGQIAPPRPLPGQKAVWCRVMDLDRGRLDIDGRLAGLAGRGMASCVWNFMTVRKLSTRLSPDPLPPRRQT